MSNSPYRAEAPVARHTLSQQTSRLVSYDRPAVAVEELTAVSQSEVPEATRPDALWSALFWSVAEGFGLYGAALHGIVTTPHVAPAPETLAPPFPSWRERREAMAVVPTAREHPGTRVSELDRGARLNRLAAFWRVIAIRGAKWQREREISQAVAALRQFDDRTLRDMGIPQRSMIEQTVRYGRDC